MFGVAFLLSPTSMSSRLDVALPTPSALSDFRSAQGGFQLGFGVLLGWCGMKADWVRCGLIAQALTSGGFVLGRLVSLAADGRPKPITYGLLALEAVGCALALVALKKIPRHVTDGI
jgi:hypothetical protein